MPRALLVDDDEPFLAALAEAVSRENFTTQTAATLKAAKAALAEGTPDIVLIDLHLPDGNGMELLEDLGVFPSTEVVLITGKASVETAVEALRRGASDYLVKPIDLGRIKAVLAKATRTRELKALAASLPWSRRKVTGGPLPILGGRYEVEEEIGEGSMGRVFRARDPLVGRVVAVKTVKAEYLSDENRTDYFRRFRREAQAAGSLSHPGIVSLFDVGDDYLVMEYVEGVTLQHLLRHERVLDFPTALRVLAPLAEALDHAHRAGVIHGDMKPANIMVQPDGRPKLMDFGVARLEAATASQSQNVFGSPSYMAPEQILGAALTHRADLFSFAVVAYETLAGRRPFQGDSVASIVYRVVHEPAPPPSSFNSALPPACDAVFARALAKDPRQRYPDGMSFVAALVGAEAGTGIAIPPPDPLIHSLLSTLATEGEATPTPGAGNEPPPPEARAGAAPAEEEPASATTTLKAAAIAGQVRATHRRRTLLPWVAAALLVAAAAVAGRSLPAPAGSGTRAATVASSGALRVETEPAGMRVWVDGTEAGPSPLVLPDLLPGTHRIRVVEPGYGPAEVTLELTPGTTAAPLRFVMTPVAARLVVTSSPAEASILLDGRRIGVTPYEGFVEGAGPRELRVEKKGHRPHVRRLVATPGVPMTVDVQLAVLAPDIRRGTPRLPPLAAAPAPAPVPAAITAPLREGDLVLLDATVRPPSRIEGRSPSYPDEARRLKLSGSVRVEMIVSEKGRPEAIRVLESAGAVLDQAVVEAVRRWRFEPASKAGVRVRTRWEYRHTFVLR